MCFNFIVDAENPQTWKVSFDAQFWRSECVHATLSDPTTIELESLEIHLESGDKEHVKGYFLVTINNPDNSVNFAESEIDAIKKSHFEEFKKTLRLLGIKAEVKWNRIKLIEPPDGAKLRVRKSLASSYQILGEPVPFEADELKSISRIHDKIQGHEHKDTVSNILSLVCLDTSDSAESFFYRWISFNLVYSYLKDGPNERASIENFACVFSSYADSPSLVTRYSDLLNTLTQGKLFNQKNDDNFSKKLQEALDANNVKHIWKYAFLCIYSIRSKFFHRNEKSAHFEALSEFLADVVIIALKEIFQSK